MKNLIIGTAGHIDHGKTSLIGALTGRSTDTLKEEQARGISIDLGFTYFDLPSGTRAGIVDVPGHERFIKNMLAGAGGIDVVLLVVAADEGIMPQTVEHMDILRFLPIGQAIIVLTKADLADPELMTLVEEDIREQTADTFLADSPLVRVDSHSGRGMAELVQAIEACVDKLPDKNLTASPRLNVDRVFSLKGHGTVVTGTLMEGTLQVDQPLTLFPQGISTKVRSLSVHGQSVSTAYAGQRTAVNLAGVKTSEASRGTVLAVTDALQPSDYIDVKLTLLPHAQRELRFWERLRVYLGTREVLARLVLMDTPTLEPGETAYAQLRLEQSVSVKRGDPLVIRFFSPMETLGGGVVIDPGAKRHGKSPATLVTLKQKEKGDPGDLASLFVQAHPGATLAELQNHLSLDQPQTQSLLDSLAEPLVLLGSGLYHQQTLTRCQSDLLNLLATYHQKHPFKKGMGKEELREKMALPLSQKVFQALIKYLETQAVLGSESAVVWAQGFTITYTGEALAIKTAMEIKIEASGYSPPSVDELTGGQTLHLDILESLIGQGLVKLGTLVMTERHHQQAEALVRDTIAQTGGINLATFRDMIGTSRKYAMALLDDMDQRKITKMVGDQRVLVNP